LFVLLIRQNKKKSLLVLTRSYKFATAARCRGGRQDSVQWIPRDAHGVPGRGELHLHYSPSPVSGGPKLQPASRTGPKLQPASPTGGPAPTHTCQEMGARRQDRSSGGPYPFDDDVRRRRVRRVQKEHAKGPLGSKEGERQGKDAELAVWWWWCASALDLDRRPEEEEEDGTFAGSSCSCRRPVNLFLFCSPLSPLSSRPARIASLLTSPSIGRASRC
jgi:hypothetical protein